MSDENCFIFPPSLLIINYIAKAMIGFLTTNKEKIAHFFINHF